MEKELEKLMGDKKIPLTTLFKRTFHYVKPELPRFLFALFLILINVGIDVVLPLIISKITTNLKSDYLDLILILVLVIGYFLLSLINQVFLYFESMILQKAGQKIIYNLRMEVFEHIENMSLDQLNDMPVGSLVTRVCSYTTSMSDLFTNVLVNVIRNVLTIVVVYVVMFTISYRLSFVLLGIVILVFIISFVFSRVISKIFRKERRYISDLNTYLNENISGMKLIQIFNQEINKSEEFSKKNEDLRKARYKVVLAFGIYRPLITFIYFVAIALTFYFGIEFGLNSGEIVAFYLLLSRFFNPVQNLADQLNNIQKALTASERLFNLLDVEPKVVDAIDAIEINEFKGKIEFRNVYFAYKDEDWILKNVSFVINPKETCAFVGATGAGKTTILSLIVRNYEIQKGQILIDDIDIKKIKVTSLRKAIGQMLQDVFLFSGTIRTNITLYDDEKYSDEEIIKVCDYVNASSFINKLDKGLDEYVIERGENFSSGQRQLLSFARTVLAKPQILILDEATANIDTETETLIQESLAKIKNIGTMLIVAHRLSTIQHSDQIIVLNNGEIVEKGTHQELLKHKGLYYKLYELQFNNN
ncbi:MAG: ABC transporter ATP-binding protein/permease [Mollicutes bacterium]|nr:ABC transporter ATP-binding protein/permease [Mollicutes bacterium]